MGRADPAKVPCKNCCGIGTSRDGITTYGILSNIGGAGARGASIKNGPALMDAAEGPRHLNRALVLLSLKEGEGI